MYVDPVFLWVKKGGYKVGANTTDDPTKIIRARGAATRDAPTRIIRANTTDDPTRIIRANTRDAYTKIIALFYALLQNEV